MKKKLIALLTAAVLILALTACAGPPASTAESAAKSAVSEAASTAAAEVSEAKSEAAAAVSEAKSEVKEAASEIKSEAAAEPVEIQVFIAASLKNVMTDIAAKYNEKHPEVTITYNADSSGKLLTQIQEGYACDIFFSAAQKQMNTLEEDGLLVEGTRSDVVNNQVVVVTLKDSGTAVTGLENISQASSIALADGSVPVGRYTRTALMNLGILAETDDPSAYTTQEVSEALGGVEISEQGNVSQVLTAVVEGSCEVGTTYYSDTYGFEDKLDILETVSYDLTGNVIYPISMVVNDEATEAETAAAADFLAFVTSDEAKEIFDSYYFDTDLDSGSAASASAAALEPAEIQVFIAASLNTVMTDLAAKYNEIHPEIKITYNADSSGKLLTQIQEGYACDIFFSAAQKQMNTLEDDGLLIEGTRSNVVNNQVVVVTLKDSGTAVTGLADIGNASSIALADGSVPVGKYTRTALMNLGILAETDDPSAYTTQEVSEALGGVEISEQGNVSQVLTAIVEGSCEVGTTYYSDTYGYEDKLDILETVGYDLTGNVIYPISMVINDEADEAETAAAADFLAFITSDEAKTVFDSYYFDTDVE